MKRLVCILLTTVAFGAQPASQTKKQGAAPSRDLKVEAPDDSSRPKPVSVPRGYALVIGI